MDKLQAAINILVKLRAARVNLIRRMDMLVNDLAYKLNLLVAAQFAQLWMLNQGAVDIVINRWREAIDNTPLLPFDAHRHGH